MSWGGRTLPAGGFDADDGHADAELRARLAAGDVAAILDGLTGARLVVPIVAQAVEVDNSGPLAVESRVEMASVTLVAADGQKALPAFTGIDSLTAWDAAARPVPVSARDVALAALAEGCDVLVLDVAGPYPRQLSASMLAALGAGRLWLAPADDPVVSDAVSRAVGPQRALRAAAVAAGDRPGDLVIALQLMPGLTGVEVSRVLEAIGAELAQDAEFRTRVDAVAFRLA